MNTRIWTIAGAVIGVLALILLTVLASLAYGAGVPSSPRFTVFVVVDILLGAASISMVASACTVRAVREASEATVLAVRQDRETYVEGVLDGVKETVDRLASVLPADKKLRVVS